MWLLSGKLLRNIFPLVYILARLVTSCHVLPRHMQDDDGSLAFSDVTLLQKTFVRVFPTDTMIEASEVGLRLAADSLVTIVKFVSHVTLAALPLRSRFADVACRCRLHKPSRLELTTCLSSPQVGWCTPWVQASKASWAVSQSASGQGVITACHDAHFRAIIAVAFNPCQPLSTLVMAQRA